MLSSLKLLLKITICIIPILAIAQNGEVEIGTGYISEDSFKLGEYTGLEDKGVYGNGSILFKKNSAYDDTNSEYWLLRGTNLGLDSRSIFGEYGHQGEYSVYIDYDHIPHNKISNVQTPYLGAGSADQTLPLGFVGATNTTGMSTLVSSLNSIDIETDRNRIGGGFSWIPVKNWGISGDYRHEIKDGTETLASIFGTNGGNPRATVLAVPVDFNVDDFNFKISRTGNRSQFQLSYHLSLFHNNNKAVVWDNAFNDPGNWCSAFCGAGNSFVEFSQGGRGRISLDPDNQAHQINFNGGYSVNSTTRITANVSYGWMQQNDTFLPFSTIQAFNTVEDLPRQSLDGKVNTLFTNVTFSSRPLKNLNVRASFIYDDRDNKTPRDVYLVVHSDSNAQADDLDSTDRRFNRPYSLEKLQFKLDAGYRLPLKNKLSIGYEYKEIDRDLSEVISVDEHTINVKLSNSFLDYASGWIKYISSSRDGTSYISNQPFLDGHDPDVIASIFAANADGLFENDPLLRRYNISDRQHDQISAAINLYPFDLVAFSFTGKYTNDDYDKTEVGLQKSKNSNVTFDVTYNPVNNLDTYTFITYENYERNQRGYRRGGGDFPPNAVRNPGDFWTIDTIDDVITIGAGLKWDIKKDKLNVKLDYTYSHAITEIVPNSINQAFLPFPEDLTTELNSLSLTGEYTLRENMRLRLKYLYQGYRTRDYALDNITINTLANVILPGNSSPNYDVNLIGLTYIYSY